MTEVLTIDGTEAHVKQPNQSYEQPQLAPDDLRYCQDKLHHGSRSFLAASFLLPVQMRKAATALYAFCREADDLVDLGVDATESLRVVCERVEQVYSDRPLLSPADRALRSVARHYSLPKALLDALIEGFAWDASHRSYQNLDALEDYAARVAGTVGAMMSVLMGARDPNVLARACDLGVAMQLTNICRDVGEDARAGRCYLPLDWLAEQGLTPEVITEKPLAQLLDPRNANKVRKVVDRLLARADELYTRADCGIAMLPSNCQRGIRMARRLYAGIGDEVARADGYDINHRAYVSGKRKLALISRHWFNQSAFDRTLLNLPPLTSTAWLVEAVQSATPARPVQISRGLMQNNSNTRDEMIAVLHIMDRLEYARRKQLQIGSGKLPMHYAAGRK